MPLPDPIESLSQLAQRHDVDSCAGRVTWRRFGDGPPLVLLHGGHGSWLHWARNVGALSRSFTLWLSDLPGHGESAMPAEPTLDGLVTATLTTLDTLVGARTPVTLAGFSFGGLVATHLAARRARVDGLALLGPAGHGGPRRPRGELIAWRDAAERGDEVLLARQMRHNLAMHMFHDPEAIDDLALRIHTQSCLANRLRTKPFSRAGGLAQTLSRYDGPLLLAWGEHDVTVDTEQARLTLAGERARCRAAVVRGRGHWVQYEGAREIDALLHDWMREIAAPDPVTSAQRES